MSTEPRNADNPSEQQGAKAPARDTYATRPTLLLRLNSTDAQDRELAWEEFRARYAPVIAGFARKLGVPYQEIDDVIQDVMLGFYSHSPTFVYDPAKGRFRGYLKVCTFRVVRTRRGQRLRFNAVPLDQIEDEDASIDQVWRDLWQQELLNRAIAATREAYRDKQAFRVFERYVINGEPAAQVAADLGLTVNAIYKAKERLALAIRAQVEAMEREDG